LNRFPGAAPNEENVSEISGLETLTSRRSVFLSSQVTRVGKLEHVSIHFAVD
jgi:hypothetical protein